MVEATIGGFARSAARQLGAREWRSLTLQLFVLLGATNALLATHASSIGGKPDPIFASASTIQAIGLLSFSVALLRVATGSPRKRWAVDAGFWLYFALSLVQLAVTAGAGWLVGKADFTALLLVQAASILLTAPLAVWMVAAAVEKPGASAPRFAGIGRWLPPLLVLALMPIVLAASHTAMNAILMQLAGTPAFWPWALVDAVTSSLLVVTTLALQLAAYRSVAQG